MDLVYLNNTLTINGVSLIEAGFLSALRDVEARAAAAKFGNPAELLKAAV